MISLPVLEGRWSCYRNTNEVNTNKLNVVVNHVSGLFRSNILLFLFLVGMLGTHGLVFKIYIFLADESS